MRTVSIAGHREDLLRGIRAMADEVEEVGTGSWHIAGNAGPDLRIDVTVEEHPEFTEPVVDYGEGG